MYNDHVEHAGDFEDTRKAIAEYLKKKEKEEKSLKR